MTTHPPPSDPDPVVEAEFDVSDADYPFVRLSEAANCRVELERILPRGDGRVAEFFTVEGADPECALDVDDEEAIVDATLHFSEETRGLVEYVVEGECPARDLAMEGAVPRVVTGTDGSARIVAEVLPGEDPMSLITEFLETHSADLVAKRRKEAPARLFGERDLQPAILERLTDRQREVLFAAFEAGYYDRPRETTGEALAAELDISSPTFQQHLRAAERKVVAYLAEQRPE